MQLVMQTVCLSQKNMTLEHKKYTELTKFDNLSMMSVQGHQTSFPFHFHDSYCITLVEEGVEMTNTGEGKLYNTQGQISTANPYEIHANPILGKSISFTTIYISESLVNFIFKKHGILFENIQMTTHNMRHQFYWVSHHISQHTLVLNQLEKLLLMLRKKTHQNVLDNIFTVSQWRDIIDYIDHNLENELSIDTLAYVANMSKFSFAKKFRKKLGLSPMNYVLMTKVLTAKKLITPHTKLTELAYQFRFADQAHFSKTFKKYIGLSPSQYQKDIQ